MPIQRSGLLSAEADLKIVNVWQQRPVSGPPASLHMPLFTWHRPTSVRTAFRHPVLAVTVTNQQPSARNMASLLHHCQPGGGQEEDNEQVSLGRGEGGEQEKKVGEGEVEGCRVRWSQQTRAEAVIGKDAPT